MCTAGVGNVLHFGGGSVMVWARICHDGRTQFKIIQGTLNVVKYRDDIIDPIVLPFLQQLNFDHVFQHDNARCHLARVCQDFLNQNHMPWPTFSPDLSPIEHLWDELGRRVRHRQNPPETPQELRGALVHEWKNITQSIQRLIGYMRRRCDAVVAARGGHTRYWTLQTSLLHDNFCLSMICSDNDVEKFCWYCLICYAHMNLNYTMFVSM